MINSEDEVVFITSKDVVINESTVFVGLIIWEEDKLKFVVESTDETVVVVVIVDDSNSVAVFVKDECLFIFDVLFSLFFSKFVISLSTWFDEKDSVVVAGSRDSVLFVP